MMTNHEPSVSPRQRRVTHIGRPKLRANPTRDRRAELLRMRPEMIESARDLYRELTDPHPTRFRGMPGIPHVSRISHKRNDEPNELLNLLDVLAARAALGEPPDAFYRVQLWLAEWSARLYGDVPDVPLPELMLLTQETLSEIGSAKIRAFGSELSGPSLEFLRDRCRAAFVGLRTLVVGINYELRRRAVEAV